LDREEAGPVDTSAGGWQGQWRGGDGGGDVKYGGERENA